MSRNGGDGMRQTISSSHPSNIMQLLVLANLSTLRRTNMKLTRAQELLLINVGLQKLIDGLSENPNIGIDKRRVPWNKGKRMKKSTWTAARRRKFAATMKAKWASKDK
jgi:hypothetical protein